MISNCNKKRGTNSIFVLACRTFPHLKFNWGNSLIPAVLGLILGVGGLYLKEGAASPVLAKLLSIFINVDGVILGLMTAGFAIYSTLPSKELVIASVVENPKDGKYSFLKYKLLTFFKGFFWVFVAMSFLLIMATFLELWSQKARSIAISPDLRSIVIFLLFSVTGFIQSKALVELKVLIFNTYTHTFNQARLLAVNEGERPFDSSID